MRATIRIAVFIALAALLLAPARAEAAPSAAPLTQPATSLSGTVRVYLSSIAGVNTLNLTIDGSYSVNGDASRRLNQGGSATVSFEGGRLYLTAGGARTDMGTRFFLRRHDTSGNNGIKIAQSRNPSNWYNGDLEFAVRNGRMYPIVYVYLEDYMQGVLPYEMSNSWPLEALKAQAVAARTYALAAMAKGAAYYDVVDTTTDQVYRGLAAGNANCRQAVAETQGVVGMYNGQYMGAYYGASNGGQTESIKNAWNVSGYPYLGVTDDPYDLANPDSVRRTYTIYATAGNSAALESLLKQKALPKLQTKGYDGAATDIRIRSIDDVRAHTPMYAAPSRLYTKVDVTLTTQQSASPVTVTLDYFGEMEALMNLSINSIKNELITVSRSGVNFQLSARRYGHGIGMSQRGAQQMANQGLSYRQIIGFYYPGVTLVQYDMGAEELPPLPGDGGSTPPPSQQQPVDPSQSAARVSLANPSEWLNLRKGPGTDTAILAQLRHGQELTALTTDGTWCQVRYGSLVGYVMQSYLVFEAGMGSDAEPTPTPDPAQTPAPDAPLYWVTVALQDMGSKLNLRSGPSTASGIVLRLAHGARLEALGQSGAWLLVRWGGAQGYVMGTYVTRDAEDGPAATPAPTSAPQAPGERYAMVAVSAGQTLNLRAAPTTSAPVLRTLPSGAQVTYDDYTAGWCRVSYGAWQGYVMSKYLSPLDDVQPTASPAPSAAPGQDAAASQTPAPAVTPAPPAVQTATVALSSSSGRLNLRAGQSTGTEVVASIPNGASVEVLAYGSAWCLVRYRGMEGYAAAAYLRLDGEGATPAPSAAPTPNAAEPFDVYVSVSGSLNLRAAPSTAAKILTTVRDGARLTALTRLEGWYEVVWQDAVAYAAAQYIAVAPAASAAHPTPSAGPAESLSLGDNSPADANTPPAMAAGTARPAPGTGSAESPSLGDNSPADANPPSEIAAGTARPAPKPQDVINEGTVRAGEADGGVALYAEANGASRGLITVPYRARVQVLAYEGKTAAWCLVYYEGWQGYLPRADLDLDAPVPADL
ncbi:MAG: SpoIID/LytB domain-containing protein [Oscillospiraceae bacterium]|nr:SpoIID/LytB domain-containing protein [Oscillospiraceae bacterium]